MYSTIMYFQYLAIVVCTHLTINSLEQNRQRIKSYVGEDLGTDSLCVWYMPTSCLHCVSTEGVLYLYVVFCSIVVLYSKGTHIYTKTNITIKFLISIAIGRINVMYTK